MVGIISYGASLPALRLPATAYKEAWGACGARGMVQKAFCAYDEDAVTLGIDAARSALGRLGNNQPAIGALFFGVTAPPFDEKPSAATLATALFDYKNIRVTEISGSPQAGMQAINSAIEYCQSNNGRSALAVVADAPIAPPDATFEHALGAAGAAFVIGPDGPVAEFLKCFSVTHETFGSRFRRRGEEMISDLELRTRDNLISIEELGKLTATSDVPKRMALGVDAGLTRGVGRLLGNSEAIVDKIWTEIGDAGAAAAPCALVATLDNMRANETVLAVGVGAGATAVAFRAGGGLSESRRKGRKFSELIKCGRVVNYIDYLKHKRLLSSRTGGKG